MGKFLRALGNALLQFRTCLRQSQLDLLEIADIAQGDAQLRLVFALRAGGGHHGGPEKMTRRICEI